MDTQAIPEHKQWAVELKSQEEFVREFVLRNPRADAIPLRTEWLGMQIQSPERGIDAFKPEDMESDEVPKEHLKNKGTDKIGKTRLYCSGHGCERTFTANIGRISHERRCVHALNTRLPKDKK